ncbi:hypothetical protein FCV25MIE_28596 [Fagus crenata]
MNETKPYGGGARGGQRRKEGDRRVCSAIEDLKLEIGPSSNPKEGDHECEGPNLAHDIKSKSESDLDDLEDGEIALSVDLGEHTGEEISVDLVTGVSPVEASVPIFHSSIGDTIVEPDYAAMVVEEPSFVTDLALVRVDLAKDFPGTAHAFVSGSSMLLCSNQEDPDSRLSVLVCHSQTEVVHARRNPFLPLFASLWQWLRHQLSQLHLGSLTLQVQIGLIG